MFSKFETHKQSDHDLSGGMVDLGGGILMDEYDLTIQSRPKREVEKQFHSSEKLSGPVMQVLLAFWHLLQKTLINRR